MPEFKPIMVPNARSTTYIAVLGLALLAAPLPVVAQESIKAVGVLQETYLNAAEISGTVVAGLQFSGLPAETRPSLAALVPSNWRGHAMCIRLASSDGRYVATQGYEISEAWDGGLVPLPYQTAYVEQLQVYEATDMAIRVARGHCEEPEGVMALAGWNIAYHSVPESIFLLVNSFRADETYLIDRLSGADYDCMPAQGNFATSFDTICPLPFSVVTGEGKAEFEVNRIRRGTFDPPEIVTIEKVAR